MSISSSKDKEQIMRSLLFIAVALLISSCAMFQPGPVPVTFLNKEIVLDQPVTILANEYSALFQYGQLISQRQLTIWDDYCRVRVENSQSESWQWKEGRYRITGFSWHDDLCSKRDCDFVQRYHLETISGIKAVEIDCRYRYAFGDPWAITGPHFLSPKRLDAVLGDSFKIVDR
jgi:hypothetical protein